MARKRIYFPEYNASAMVGENCSQETIDMLKKMCHLAYHDLPVPPAMKCSHPNARFIRTMVGGYYFCDACNCEVHPK